MRSQLRELIAGLMVEVDSDPEYYDLSIAFDRVKESTPNLQRRTLIRKKVGPFRWAVAFVERPCIPPPKVRTDARRFVGPCRTWMRAE